ncbi:uncharacterized protein METZ01_LOCUS369227 [marine metagenome]|uniref:Uncharacterized protein n=1 Tax=marine metagenome TaxID=408172 RepID=A0A382T332_9ZZZZ
MPWSLENIPLTPFDFPIYLGIHSPDHQGNVNDLCRRQKTQLLGAGIRGLQREGNIETARQALSGTIR